MADIINVVVKATNGTTDVTYTALQGATATEPAIWSDLSSSVMFGNRDGLQMKSRNNGTKTARRIEVEGMYPIRRVVSGVETVVGGIPLVFSVAEPNVATDAEISEAVDRFINALASVHMRTCIKRRFAPS